MARSKDEKVLVYAVLRLDYEDESLPASWWVDEVRFSVADAIEAADILGSECGNRRGRVVGIATLQLREVRRLGGDRQ